MWTLKAKRINTFLHKSYPEIDPCTLNRCVDVALQRTSQLSSKLDQPCPVDPKSANICSEIFVNPTKLRRAYGNLGIEKLVKEIQSTENPTKINALKLLTESLRDHTDFYNAINVFDIVKKLHDNLRKFHEDNTDNREILNLIFLNIQIIASRYEGAKRIIDEHNLIDRLFNIILDENCLSSRAAFILKEVVQNPKVCMDMVCMGYLSKVRDALDRLSDRLPELFEILAYLIEQNPSTALNMDYFDYLIKYISTEGKIQPVVMKCFALLLSCHKSQEYCDKADIIGILYQILSNETNDLELLEFAALALQNSMFSTRALWRCREFWDLPIILIRLAHNKENSRLQLYSLQILRQITALPSIKNFVRKACKHKIKNIYCRTIESEKIKYNLLSWLRMKCYKQQSRVDDNIISMSEEENDPDEENPLDSNENKPIKQSIYRVDFRA